MYTLILSLFLSELCVKYHYLMGLLSALSGTENPTEAPVVFTDFHVSVLTEEDGAIKVGWNFGSSNRKG
jgi:hypothetical protein